MTRNYLDILAETIRNNWDQQALTDFYLTEDGKAQDTSRGNHYTYGEMYTEIVRVADLLTYLGLKSGDHIAICGTNSAHWVIAFFAVAKIKGVSIMILPNLMPEQKYQISIFSDAKALFVDKTLWNELQEQTLPHIQCVLSLDDWQVLKPFERECFKSTDYQSMVKTNIAVAPSLLQTFVSFPYSDPNELAHIFFTSGTSGKSKGVMFSWYQYISYVLHTLNVYHLGSNKQALSIVPMAHGSGLGVVLTQLIGTCSIHFLKSSISPSSLLTSIFSIQPYAILVIPQLTSIFLTEEFHAKFMTSSKFLEYFVIGGAGISQNIAEELQKNEYPITLLYGLTESHVISMVHPSLYRINSSGKIVSGMTCRIAPNGEILVKGDNVMLGYYKDSEATAQKIDKDGWLHTGDKGHLDEDGYLYVEGRLEQDIIVLPNGENIRPDNIESLINALPEVKESIVLARDGKLVAIIVPQITNHQSPISNADLRRSILRTVNPQLPLFSQLYDIEITDLPLQRTEKQTIKRYLYK